MEKCLFQRFHNIFDKRCVYGDICIGIQFHNIRGEVYYCIDIRNTLTPELHFVHMDCESFERCVKLLGHSNQHVLMMILS